MPIQVTGPMGRSVKADGIAEIIIATAWGVVIVLRGTAPLWLPYLIKLVVISTS